MSDAKTIFGLIGLLFFMMFAAVAAPIAVFAVKAGLLRVPVHRDMNIFTMVFYSILFSGAFVIALIFLSIFWHIGIAAWDKPLVPVFVRYYESPSCRNFCGFSAWWNMLSEAWPYFLATTVTIFAKACGDWRRSRAVAGEKRSNLFYIGRVLRFFLPPIIAGAAFLLFLYGDEIIAAFQQYGLGNGIAVFFHKWMYEIESLADPIIALRNGESFGGWIEGEVIKLHVSLFKLSALYPKIFWAFILLGFVTRMQDA